jgi:anaerobic nitric oxide reductase transcription regulator
LENVISRGVLRATRGAAERGQPVLILPEHLDLQVARMSPPDSAIIENAQYADQPRSLAEKVDAFRRRTILEAVDRHKGNWAAAARELGLHRSNLHQLATRLGLRLTSERKQA